MKIPAVIIAMGITILLFGSIVIMQTIGGVNLCP